jgi:hypothetical protein
LSLHAHEVEKALLGRDADPARKPSRRLSSKTVPAPGPVLFKIAHN